VAHRRYSARAVQLNPYGDPHERDATSHLPLQSLSRRELPLRLPVNHTVELRLLAAVPLRRGVRLRAQLSHAKRIGL